MFSTEGDGKRHFTFQLFIERDTQLLGIFKQEDKDYPMKNEINIAVKHLFYDFNILKCPQQ